MISFKCDLNADAMYVTLSDAEVARTLEVDGDPGTMVDVDADGKLIGIEVIGPRGRLWPLQSVLRDYEIPQAEAQWLMACYPQPPLDLQVGV
jgi:uncharacterized protein YuzE